MWKGMVYPIGSAGGIRFFTKGATAVAWEAALIPQAACWLPSLSDIPPHPRLPASLLRTDPLDWQGSDNPRIEGSQHAQDVKLALGELAASLAGGGRTTR